MSTTLYLYIGAAWPQHNLACPWRLCHAGGAVHDGESPPAGWPKAERHVIVLSADQVRYALLNLPPGLRWDDGVALAMALEERLAGPVEQQVVVPVRRAGEATCCAVVQRSRLTTLQSCFGELKKPLSRIECEADKLAPPDAGWAIYRSAYGDWLHDGQKAAALDPIDDTQVPVVVQLALAEAAEHKPKQLLVAGATKAQAELWARLLHTDVRAAPPYAWQAHCARPGVNLLVGDLAPRRRMLDMPQLRIAALLLALAFGGKLGLDASAWAGAAMGAAELHEQQHALLRSAGVAETANHARPDQAMREAWSSARARLGEPAPDEFLPMLSTLADALPSRRWNRIEFSHDKLVVNWQGQLTEAAQVEERLARSGYQSVAKPHGDEQISTALRFGGEP